MATNMAGAFAADTPRGQRKMKRKSTPKSKATKSKMHKTMSEFKHGTLHSGSKHGPKVKNRKQAIAIGLNQARKSGRKR
jgi:hypothetical protein